MEFRVRQYFLAVAREQSFAGAAESLHLFQPTLSRQLKNLKKGLGYAVCFDGLINTQGTNLCFRPLRPALSIRAGMIWKKYQLLSNPARKFLETMRELCRA